MSEWWRDAIFYEIYVRSFVDSDGDGVGDLPGVHSRLPYVRDLGVDAIWLTPFYPSPGVDNGYDVAWLPIPEEWAELAVERQADDPSSLLALYRSAIALRPQLEGDVTWRESPPGTLVFERGEVVCAVSVDGSPLDPPAGEVLLATENAA